MQAIDTDLFMKNTLIVAITCIHVSQSTIFEAATYAHSKLNLVMNYFEMDIQSFDHCFPLLALTA